MRKKIASIPIITIIALSIIGMAYADWVDQVTINGTMYTGSVHIVFDPREDPLVYHDNEPGLPLPKDIAWADIYYEDIIYWETDCITQLSGPKTIYFDIYNGYPCYWVYFTNIVVMNIGTVPVHIDGLTTVVRDEDRDITLVRNNDIQAYVYPTAPTEPVIKIVIKNWVCNQLEDFDDPETDTDERTAKGEIDIHIEQYAKECTHYSFAFTIHGVQWNKPGP